MSKMRRVVFAAVVALAGLVPAACGDDSAPEVTAPTVTRRALSDTVSTNSTPPPPQPSSPFAGSGNREGSDTTTTR